MSHSDHDPRRNKRLTSMTRTPLAIDSGSGVVVENSSTIDMSESGVRVRTRNQIMAGQIVDVFWNKRPEHCRVVWISPDDGTHELIAGLEFIRPLSDPYRRKTPPPRA
jgi:hypothetical protein